MATIYHQYRIRSSVEKVFSAITKPEEYINWWPNKCSGIPLIGNDYNFYFTDEYNWHAVIARMEEPNLIEFKMTKSDLDWEPTSFGFELEKAGDNVVVNFYHKDWLVESNHFKIASFCWAMLLNGLKNYVERGIVVPFKERS
ncbi:MAG: SRPBCC domain-containing protein [Saprospiraceae bacterium]|nr:SRPBCC domain-containing protein [Saprospiraceae bacterium]